MVGHTKFKLITASFTEKRYFTSPDDMLEAVSDVAINFSEKKMCFVYTIQTIKERNLVHL